MCEFYLHDNMGANQRISLRVSAVFLLSRAAYLIRTQKIRAFAGLQSVPSGILCKEGITMWTDYSKILGIQGVEEHYGAAA